MQALRLFVCSHLAQRLSITNVSNLCGRERGYGKVLPRRFASRHVQITTDLINFTLLLFQILERLDHVSIVRLEEVFYAEGKVLMVLEYLPGGDLFDGLVSRPFYSEKDACACAHQIITALNYLSKKGIIHRVRNDTHGAP